MTFAVQCAIMIIKLAMVQWSEINTLLLHVIT